MAADRVARGRAGADAVLAVDPARGDRLRRSGRLGSAALAHRAGLPGSQAGSRARALRGPRLARLPPSRHAVHRGLWLSDRRAGEIFPPQAQVAPGVSKRLAFPRVTDPAGPPIRPERHVPNSTATTFSDAIAAVRREIWRHQNSCTSRTGAETIKIPRPIWDRMTNALAYAA